MNPVDWSTAWLLKDSQNRYRLGDPGTLGTPMIWSKPVISTPSQTLGRFTTIDAPRWGVICDNEEPPIRISDQQSDFFDRGMIAIRAHARLGFVTERSGAAIYGNTSHAG